MITLYDDLVQNKELEEPGQFTVYECTISTKVGDVNVNKMVESFNIYESIFKTFITGDLTILDVENFLNIANITGTEPVKIKFGTKGSKHRIDVDLIVYKIKDKEKINENTNRYTLSLVSPEFLTDIRTKISKSFDGTYSDMVKNIYSDYLSSGTPLWLEKVNNNNRVIIPNKSPVDAINMISQFAIAGNCDNSNFLFFQTTKSFHFRSITEMIYLGGILPEGLTFRIEKGEISPLVSIASKATRAIEFEIKSDLDILRNTKLGTYGSTLIKHDIRGKVWRESEWSYHDQYVDNVDGKYYVKIGTYPISPDGPVTQDGKNLSDFPKSNITMISSAEEHSYQTLQNISEFSKLDYENTILTRKSEMTGMNLLRAKLTIGGMSGIQAGDIISIFITTPYSSHSLEGGVKDKDEKLSGKWLVESVSHQVSEKYYSVLMLIRDSVPEEQTNYTSLIYKDSTPEIIDASPSGSTNKKT
jgi:hypothetical protein